MLPNLLLAFGLLGTFFGITVNLYHLSQTINQAEGDIANLVVQLQTPLQSMGIAFITSLTAIACSSLLNVVNLRCNTNLAKSLLISSLEDYLDNIFQRTIEGRTRLDKAIDRMVKQQEEFLTRFHEKVGQVLETTIGNAANKMVAANQSFHNNVDSLVSRFQDVSGTLAISTDNFQASAFSLKKQVETITEIVPLFQASSQQLASGATIFQQGAEKIEQSKFSENLENLTADLAITQKEFSQSTAFLGNQVNKIAESHQQATALAQQVYSQLQEASQKIQNSATNFVKATETIQQSDFADKLVTATKELTVIPRQLTESTAILHQSTDSINDAIAAIHNSAQQIINLVEQVNNLNQHSTKLLNSSDKRIELEITSFNQIQTELTRTIEALNKHREQVNLGLENFGDRLFSSFEQQTNNYTQQLQQVNSDLNNLGNLGDRLLENFEQQSGNNLQEIQKLIAEFKQFMNHLNTIPSEIAKLLAAIEQHEQQMNSDLNNLGNSLTNKASQQIDSYNQQIQKITEKFKRII